MKRSILILFLTFNFLMSFAQEENKYPMTDPQFLKDIDTYISQEKNKVNKELLQKFRNKYNDSTSRLNVQRESTKEYEIWIDHSTKDGYSWAEGYTLNKKTGKTDMIWHEHPIKNEPIIFKENKPDTVNNKKPFKCRKPLNKKN